MPSIHVPRALCELLDRFVAEPAIRDVKKRLDRFGGVAGNWSNPEVLIALYQDSLPIIERMIWSAGPDVETLETYRHAFRELEGLIQQQGVDRRHRFFIIIPVADRPRHLHNLFDSLLSQCRAFGYGGFDEHFNKIVVVVADDSRDESNIRRNREIVQAFRRRGLQGIYFGADGQLEVLNTLTPAERERLTRILGEPGRTGMRHKGASVTRNIAYLLAGSLGEPDNSLFVFVDSDEQFKVRIPGPEGSEDILALNYFHSLDRLFTECNVKVATGKVVGDPPVSPAVMAGNFLGDVIAFLEFMAAIDPNRPCDFHDDTNTPGDAAYHDMAGLFGFRQEQDSCAYRCTLRGVHDHAACLSDFADRLDHFFDGEHPTRPTYYSFSDAVVTATSARTVYTGNYVLSAEALKYFIPFADLKLRMAGPTLGRLIQAELGDGFVVTNLPLLHTRTVDEQFEFRPGIDRRDERVDLSGEFERQFFGDVMLFTISELIALGYPDVTLADRQVREAIETVEERMRRFYAEKRQEVQERLAVARGHFDNPDSWWQSKSDLAETKERFQCFFDNIEHNFGPDSHGHVLIATGEHRNKRMAAIQRAITSYPADRAAWESLLHRLATEHGFAHEYHLEEVAT